MGHRLLLLKPLFSAKVGQNVLPKKTPKMWNHSNKLVQISLENNRLWQLF